MPTSVALSWLEGRMDAERVIAGRAIQTVLAPMGSKPAAAAKAGGAGQPALA
jgi:biopolymer transport protein ExbB